MSILRQFQNEVGAWGDYVFRKSTIESITAHLAREVIELSEEKNIEEVADCFLLLLHVANKLDRDLLEAAEVKFEINKLREWGKPDEDGVVEHIHD